MELEKESENHMGSLEHLIQMSIHSIDNMSPNTQTPLTEYFDQVMNLKEEEERNLEGLKEKIKGIENTRETTKQHLASLEKKIDVLRKEKENLQEQKVLKTKHLTKVKKQHASQENTVSLIEKQLMKVSESNVILDRNKKELLLYKQMTGVSWDYKAPPHLVTGYVTNKGVNFIKPFTFNKEEMFSSQITNALWDIISLSSANQKGTTIIS